MTLWRVASVGVKHTGGLSSQNILEEKSAPIPYAKRSTENSVARSWRLLIDDSILRHIKKCTEGEARRVLQNENWTLSQQELDTFIALRYPRGLYSAKEIRLNDLWSSQWGVGFFSATMGRNRFREIMKCFRLDMKTQQRSVFSQTNLLKLFKF
jgi:hypothetical protein